MSEPLEFVLRAILIGVGATLVMDGWAFLLRQFGIPSLNFALLGRWIGHLRQGQWMHENIAKAAPVGGELLIGWCAHYSIGVAFAALLLATFGLKWARSPSFYPALFIGIVTVVAPLFVLQPALGAGVASSKTATSCVQQHEEPGHPYRLWRRVVPDCCRNGFAHPCRTVNRTAGGAE